MISQLELTSVSNSKITNNILQKPHSYDLIRIFVQRGWTIVEAIFKHTGIFSLYTYIDLHQLKLQTTFALDLAL